MSLDQAGQLESQENTNPYEKTKQDLVLLAQKYLFPNQEDSSTNRAAIIYLNELIRWWGDDLNELSNDLTDLNQPKLNELKEFVLCVVFLHHLNINLRPSDLKKMSIYNSFQKSAQYSNFNLENGTLVIQINRKLSPEFEKLMKLDGLRIKIENLDILLEVFDDEPNQSTLTHERWHLYQSKAEQKINKLIDGKNLAKLSCQTYVLEKWIFPKEDREAIENIKREIQVLINNGLAEYLDSKLLSDIDFEDEVQTISHEITAFLAERIISNSPNILDEKEVRQLVNFIVRAYTQLGKSIEIVKNILQVTDNQSGSENRFTLFLRELIAKDERITNLLNTWRSYFRIYTLNEAENCIEKIIDKLTASVMCLIKRLEENSNPLETLVEFDMHSLQDWNKL
ncbi:MAG: hypothetical protein OHK0017_05540 [Patescibacteria group bacterium]